MQELKGKISLEWEKNENIASFLFIKKKKNEKRRNRSLVLCLQKFNFVSIKKVAPGE